MVPALSDAQLRTLLEWSPGVIFVIDGDGTLRYVTPSSKHLLGCDPGDLCGSTLDEYVHPDDRDAVEAAVADFDGEATHPDVDVRVRDGDDAWTWLELASIRPSGPSRNGVVLVTRPAAERKAHERTIERLSVVNRVLRHDLRNDVHVVLNWLDGLASELADEADETPLDRIRNAARHMVALTEEARDYEETVLTDEETGAPGRLAPVVERVVERRRELYPEATVAVEEPPAVTVAVHDVLDSVFRNLLNNAVQHNDREHPAVAVTFEETDESVLVRVADDGPGISDERKRALVPDDRHGIDGPGVDGTGGPSGTGVDTAETGVGLTIVTQVVDAVGGDVRIEDKAPADPPRTDDESRGTVFVVELPTAGGDYVDRLIG
ncbi:MAG: ATP-binding protein [Haloarculaceae archaeon]